jgi:hypothetical protein
MLEDRDRLGDVVLRDLKVLLPKTAHRPAAPIHHGHVQFHEVYIHPE